MYSIIFPYTMHYSLMLEEVQVVDVIFE